MCCSLYVALTFFSIVHAVLPLLKSNFMHHFTKEHILFKNKTLRILYKLYKKKQILFEQIKCYISEASTYTKTTQRSLIYGGQ